MIYPQWLQRLIAFVLALFTRRVTLVWEEDDTEPTVQPPTMPDKPEAVHPAIERELELDDQDPELASFRLDQSATRLRVRTNYVELVIAASDVELLIDDGVRIAHLIVETGAQRVRVLGGTFGEIEV